MRVYRPTYYRPVAKSFGYLGAIENWSTSSKAPTLALYDEAYNVGVAAQSAISSVDSSSSSRPSSCAGSFI